MALENEPNSPQQELKPENKKIYRLESGAVVELEWEVTNPTKEQEGQPKETVIFLPGWGMQAEDTSNDGLQKAFSLNRQTYTITSSSKEKNYDLKQDGNEKPDLLNEEAKAIAQFIKEHGITNVTIAGHSRGGSKAINLTKILQGDPELDINGLILMGAVGLYEQTKVGLAKDFIVDGIKTIITTPFVRKQASRVTKDIAETIGKEFIESGANYPTDFLQQLSDMAEINPRTGDIKVPVVIISGTMDQVSDPKKIVPKEKVQTVLNNRAESGLEGVGLSSRGEVLQRSVFTQSPYVVMIAPEKLGHHGLPIFRSEQMARTSLKLIERANRKLNPVNSGAISNDEKNTLEE